MQSVFIFYRFSAGYHRYEKLIILINYASWIPCCYYLTSGYVQPFRQDSHQCQ